MRGPPDGFVRQFWESASHRQWAVAFDSICAGRTARVRPALTAGARRVAMNFNPRVFDARSSGVPPPE
jgi:hypothetical protein